MKKSTIVLCVIGLLVVIVLVGGWRTYNSMVDTEETVDQAWANVQASYQRRFDLIPNLVNTVKGYAEHEKSTLENVTNARAGLIGAGDSLMALRNNLSAFNPNSSGPSLDQMQQLEGKMSFYINAVHEAYPDLKANENFKDLQTQLESTENRINTERNKYNESVKEYNVTIRTFPRNIFARMFGFNRKNPFGASAEAQSAPKVEF